MHLIGQPRQSGNHDYYLEVIVTCIYESIIMITTLLLFEYIILTYDGLLINFTVPFSKPFIYPAIDAL
jgi:hypothetical protein